MGRISEVYGQESVRIKYLGRACKMWIKTITITLRSSLTSWFFFSLFTFSRPPCLRVLQPPPQHSQTARRSGGRALRHLPVTFHQHKLAKVSEATLRLNGSSSVQLQTSYDLYGLSTRDSGTLNVYSIQEKKKDYSSYT